MPSKSRATQLQSSVLTSLLMVLWYYQDLMTRLLKFSRFMTESSNSLSQPMTIGLELVNFPPIQDSLLVDQMIKSVNSGTSPKDHLFILLMITLLQLTQLNSTQMEPVWLLVVQINLSKFGISEVLDSYNIMTLIQMG